MRSLPSLFRIPALALPLGASLLGVAPSGCRGAAPGVSTYELTVRCRTSDARPVPLVAISSERALVGSVTDSNGVATLLVDGREGEEVPLRVDKLPPDHTLATPGPERRLVLKNVGKKGAEGIQVVHDISLRRTKETYVVLVAAEQVAGLPITANGIEKAQLNSRGAAAFRLEGRPGDELKVAIVTASEPRASEPDPSKVFVLPENGGVLAFRSGLSILPEEAVPEIRKRKKLKVKPKNEPKQIPFGQTVSARGRK
jgi:hypothetical protein